MKKLAVLPSLFGASLLATASAQACAPENALELTSLQEAPFQAYAELGLETISQPFEIDLYLCGDAIENIERIKVDAIMPAHQHGMNYSPEITAIEPGIYRISGMFFHMPGMWELQVSTHPASETNAKPYLFTLDITAR